MRHNEVIGRCNSSNARQAQRKSEKPKTSTKEILWEMAFVLHLTEAIKEQLLAEKNGHRDDMPLALFSYKKSGS